ncbi:hypothetical protein PT974_08000 [Cladobotryum mycophilum]|uniref:Uncharacterized protein n=1 Tax=Cladobotryum mycophilum TaxID=491253 RepID=A0ABR0SC57_9HYPO
MAGLSRHPIQVGHTGINHDVSNAHIPCKIGSHDGNTDSPTRKPDPTSPTGVNGIELGHILHNGGPGRILPRGIAPGFKIPPTGIPTAYIGDIQVCGDILNQNTGDCKYARDDSSV